MALDPRPSTLDPLDPPPEYLQGVEGLPAELADLAEESETRFLTANERHRLRRGIRAACKRVLEARRRRDGKA
jgi:hypothetical protein